MPRRKQSDLDFLLFLPWWVSAGLGVLAFLLSASFVGTFASAGGPIGKGLAQGLGWLPFLVLFLFGGISLASAFLGQRRKTLIDGQTSVESIRALSWSAFEIMVAEAYRRQGYQVDQSLAGGADGGVDFVAIKDGQKCLVQCKQWRTLSVGVSVVREIYGVQMAERAHRSTVITSGDFTHEAAAFAKNLPIDLVNGQQLQKMVRGVQAFARIPAAGQSNQTPSCPKCGAPMVLRTAKRGASAGSSFWGCSTFGQTKCNGTRPANR